MGDLDDLAAISRYAGDNLLLVQGGGGNTSVKSAHGRRMWIKASGLRLAQVRADFGHLETDVPTLRALLDDPTLAAQPRQAAHEAAVLRTQAAVLGETTLRPSLETTFHAVLGRLVLHTHAVYVNAFTCMAGGADALTATLGDAPVWVPYATPGYALGRAVAWAARGWQAQRGALPATVVLANHGLIAAGHSAAEVVQDTERLAAAGKRFYGALPAEACDRAASPAALATWAEGLRSALTRRFALSAAAFSVRPATRAALMAAAHEPEQWLLAGALVPDDVVYGGHTVWVVDPARSADAWLDGAPEAWLRAGRMIVAVRGLGVIFAGPSAGFIEAMEENLLAHVLVRRLAARRGEAVRLPPEEVEYLLAMESEKYRQEVAARTV